MPSISALCTASISTGRSGASPPKLRLTSGTEPIELHQRRGGGEIGERLIANIYHCARHRTRPFRSRRRRSRRSTTRLLCHDRRGRWPRRRASTCPSATPSIVDRSCRRGRVRRIRRCRASRRGCLLPGESSSAGGTRAASYCHSYGSSVSGSSVPTAAGRSAGSADAAADRAATRSGCVSREVARAGSASRDDDRRPRAAVGSC